jgi:hypothetical protein
VLSPKCHLHRTACNTQFPQGFSLAERVPEMIAQVRGRVTWKTRAAPTLGQTYEGFQARRDIDAVTEDVLVLDDHVAEIDPDPEPDPAVLGHTGFAIDHRALHLGGTADGVHDAGEFYQHPVAGRLDDAAGMLGMVIRPMLPRE